MGQITLAVALERLARLANHRRAQRRLRRQIGQKIIRQVHVGIAFVDSASGRLKRTPSRLGRRRPARQGKAIATADSQVFRLNCHHRIDVRQIKHPNQTGFALAHFAPGFRGDDLNPGPGGEAEGACCVMRDA